VGGVVDAFILALGKHRAWGRADCALIPA
jgi:hypothetical protein